MIDFGISRALNSTTLTAKGMMIGTPGFMSPEQASGSQVGPASDVFSLGCVLAYAAAGIPPFGDGSAAAVLYRVVSGQPDLASMPPGLREIVAACLAKDPAGRPGLAAVAAMISRDGPAAASPTSFWPGPLVEAIRLYQAECGYDASYAMATHTMTERQSGPGQAAYLTAPPAGPAGRVPGSDPGPGRARPAGCGRSAVAAAVLRSALGPAAPGCRLAAGSRRRTGPRQGGLRRAPQRGPASPDRCSPRSGSCTSGRPSAW